MLPGYVAEAHRRLRWRWRARLTVLVLAAVLVLTAVGASLVVWLVPSSGVLGAVRLGLYGMLAVGVAASVLRRRRRDETVAELERRVPAFAGRLQTWADGHGRGEDGDLFKLLEGQTTVLAAAHPAARTIPSRDIALPALGALLLSLMLGLLLGGSLPLQLAGQRLWTGELFAAAQPRIRVEPGDAVVRRGSDVVVNAAAVGFRPGEMVLHADFGSGWEQAPMAEQGDAGFGFVLVGIGDGVDYYVTGRGLSSGRFRIDVADLPEVLSVTSRYRFPAWTALPEQTRSGGDVIALPGTAVEITVTADRALDDALLIVNGEAAPMSPSPAAEATARAEEPVHSARGTFTVSTTGSWHVAVRHDGALARISDRYLIEMAEDTPPSLTFAWPGHDRSATAIEEVALEFAAEDDYGVNALTLNYAVNGGAWTEAEIPDGSYLLELERVRVEDGEGSRALVPGDVISLYAEARDQSQRTRSSLYFVDVRPFEMRYRESQQMAGQNGGEGSGFDIAERQRDLLTATWNLINKQERGLESATARQALADEAEILAALQRTLAEQVETLVARSAARGLGRDDAMSAFIGELTRALEHMGPAASHLADQALEAAIPAEQQALKHLATAETSVRDVEVSLARNQGRGTSGRGLDELIELEMDPERNRYEMPQQPDFAEQADGSPDERWEQLEALAARQEQLARRPRGASESLPARWEQARLQRELERLREELEASSRGGSGGPGPDDAARALADVDRARRALDAPDGDQSANQQQAAEALRQAARALREASQGTLQTRIDRAQRRAENLQADQQRIMEALEARQAASLERAREGQSLARSDFGMQTFAEVKRRMQDDLAQLRAELTDISDAAGDLAGAETLDRALRELDEVRVDERLAASANAFDVGQPLYVIGSEALVEDALARLARRIDQAGRALADQTARQTEDPLSEVRALRRRLVDAQETQGGVDAGVVERIAAELSRLGGTASEDSDRAGAGAAAVPEWMTDRYRIRGTAEENTEQLLRLTLDRLDLAEAALMRREALNVRAQEPRASGRDSSAAARYFRELSRTTRAEEGSSEPR